MRPTRIRTAPFTWKSRASLAVLTIATLLTPVLAENATSAEPTGPVAAAVTYEAEDGTVGGGTRIDSNNAGFTGRGFANFPASGGFLQFGNVDGGGGGGAELTIRFANGSSGSRTGRLLVNSAAQSITFPVTGSWTTWQTLALPASLASGTANTIRFESTGQDLANIDHMVVASSGNVGAPTITGQPQSQTAPTGSTVTFSVTATGTAPLSYQWRKDGASIPAATNSSYTISNVQPAHAGSYTVVVSNSAGSVASNPATLTVAPVPGGLIGYAAANAWGQNGTTGGAGGQTVDVDTASEFLSAIANANPLIIRVSGMITLPGPMHNVTSNKTILGVGANSGITQGGLNIGLPIDNAVTSPPANAVKNIIIRNMNFTNWVDDAINVQMFSHHIWIDHNHLTNGFDGGVDVKRGSSYVTVSWNHHDGTAKNMLLGHADNNAAQDSGRLKVTYHHNFFDRANSRSPRVRYGDPVHVYNNYYLDIGDYGVRSAEHAGVLVEGNYFENVQDPYHVEAGATGPGRLVARNNCFVNSEQGSASGSVGNPPYSYTLDPACSVKAVVMAGAGTGKI